MTGKKKPSTPRSRVKNALRQLWLRSRERAGVVKIHNNTCRHCGKKGSVAKGREVKIQVHHDPPIGDKWEKIIDLIFSDILQSNQVPLCEECHKNEHNYTNSGRNSAISTLNLLQKARE